jgi:hypothetical protein
MEGCLLLVAIFVAMAVVTVGVRAAARAHDRAVWERRREEDRAHTARVETRLAEWRVKHGGRRW